MTDSRYTLDRSARDTLRELDLGELADYYEKQRCPVCETPTGYFIRGPRGGFSVNVECPNCRARLNVVDAAMIGRWYPWGQMIRRPVDGYIPWKV